jgi:hypothetical protein
MDIFKISSLTGFSPRDPGPRRAAINEIDPTDDSAHVSTVYSLNICTG